jgi:hypothetical protein
MADSSYMQTNAPIDLIELTEQQAELMMIALDIGAYPNQEALLQAGFADVKAKVDVWVVEMERRAEGPWLDGEDVFNRLREKFSRLAKERGEV